MSLEGEMTLAAKPHAFAGAVLSPKHARELTPSLCLAIASALAEQSYRKTAVPYTLWITEAWRVLGWAEPSAALFWEMATMYHTLYLAGRAYESDFQEPSYIPPILSCGSTSSLGSGNTHLTDRPMPFDKKKYSTAASAKELPVWLVGIFLLLHCEEMAYQRNLSGLDDRRFYGDRSEPPVLNNGGKVDFTSLLKHPSLSPRYVSANILLRLLHLVDFDNISSLVFFLSLGLLELAYMLDGTMTIRTAQLIFSVICVKYCSCLPCRTMPMPSVLPCTWQRFPPLHHRRRRIKFDAPDGLVIRQTKFEGSTMRSMEMLV